MAKSFGFQPDTNGLRIGPLWFLQGYSGVNVGTVMLGAYISLMLLTFMNFIQPYVIVEIVKVPEDRQGALTGFLASLQEVIVIMLMGLIGALSDRTGRRILWMAGFLILAIGYFIYPLATSELQLIAFRIIYSVGAAMIPVMLSACIVDCVQEFSRGKWIGVTSICNGIGIITMSFLLAKLPARFEEMGFSAVISGRYTFWIVTGLCVLGAIVVRLGLKRGRPSEVKEKPNVFKNFGRGISEAARNPSIALCYATGFVARGDLVIIGTFFSLWIVRAGADAGISTGESFARAGILFGILIQGSALLWSYFMGMICDRFNRITGVAIAFALASVGYYLMSQVADPFSSWIIPACIILGIGEVSTVISAGSLMGQEAPPEYRGAVVGVFNLSGAIGIMITVFVGGMLFDSVGWTAPFLMMAVLNTIVLAWAIWLRLNHRKSSNSEAMRRAN